MGEGELVFESTGERDKLIQELKNLYLGQVYVGDIAPSLSRPEARRQVSERIDELKQVLGEEGDKIRKEIFSKEFRVHYITAEIQRLKDEVLKLEAEIATDQPNLDGLSDYDKKRMWNAGLFTNEIRRVQITELEARLRRIEEEKE